MALTPNIMMALEGLVANTALSAGGISGQATYEAQPIVALYTTLAAGIQAQVGGNYFVSQVTSDNFITALDNTAPYLSNRAAGSNATEAGSVMDYTTILDQHRENLFPVGPIPSWATGALASAYQAQIDANNQVFVQYALIAMGAKDLANKYVNSAVNAQALTAQTFTSQDALMTANIAAVTTNPQAWGQELLNSGKLYNFRKICHYGTPQMVIEALMESNTLGLISDELEAQGVKVVDLVTYINSNPNSLLVPLVQKNCYVAFGNVTGDKLEDILGPLGFTTPGITSLADLLDIRKVFPTTFHTITAPFNGTLRKIFNTNGSLTGATNGLSAPVRSILPPILSKSNYAYLIALGQITGISNSTPEKVGTAASTIEDNTGLSNTGGLNVALPASTTNFVVGEFGGGSAPDTAFYLSDFIGAAAGIPQNASYSAFNTYIPQIQVAGGFAGLYEILDLINNILFLHTDIPGVITFTPGDGSLIDYNITIDAGNPGAGSYNGDVDYWNYGSPIAALTAELPAAIAAYATAYPTQHAAMLEASNGLIVGVVGAIKQLWDANVRFHTTYVAGYETRDLVNEPSKAFNNANINGLPAQRSSTIAFAENLGQYGKMTDKYNIAEILEAMATNTLGGDAIVAAMREGRNKDKLDAAGIKGDNQINPNPATVEPGNIS